MRVFFTTVVIWICMAGLSMATPPPIQHGAVEQSVNCLMIRVAEMLYILENCDTSPRNQKIRSWIIAKIQFELQMMETLKLDRKQGQFVQSAKQRISKQK
jgi:hypothetical protein